jgi:large repetitive protein
MRSLPLGFLLLFANLSLAAVSITTSSLPNGAIGVSYSATVQAPGGCTPYHWKISSGALPPGLILSWPSAAYYARITGKPTNAGSYSFTVWVKGCGGHISSHAYTVKISAATGESITTSSLPNGTVGLAYSANVQAPGGCTPYQWKIASGALPPGLSLSWLTTTTYSTIAGKPTMPGTYSFTVRVQGCGGHISSHAYTVVIASTTRTIQHVVSLFWAPSTSSDITGYNVYRAAISTGPYSRINSGGLVAASLYDDSTVKSGMTYFYVVTTVNSSGIESGFSNQVKTVVTYP